MTDMSKLEKSEVQSYITLLDGIINRMANNSANAKNWLMTILAAAIAIQWGKDQLANVIWLLVPTVLFALTDMYYLGMERFFKDKEEEFIEKARAGENVDNLVYVFPKTTKCQQVCNTIRAIDSLSIWPFYLIVIASIFVIYIVNTPCA